MADNKKARFLAWTIRGSGQMRRTCGSKCGGVSIYLANVHTK